MNSRLSIVFAIALLLVGVLTATIVGNQVEPVTEDLNHDGVVDIQDFSIALYLVDTIKQEIEKDSYQPSN